MYILAGDSEKLSKMSKRAIGGWKLGWLFALFFYEQKLPYFDDKFKYIYWVIS
jgi:hypothetical protein